MAISWNIPALINKIAEDVPFINTLLTALSKWKPDSATTSGLPSGAKRLETITGGRQIQEFNGSSTWSSVGKLMHDVDTVDGFHASQSATASNVAVRKSNAKLAGDIEGNANTATTLQTARTIAISGGATGTATSFNGGANITIPVTGLDMAKATAGTLATGRGGTGRTDGKVTDVHLTGPSVGAVSVGQLGYAAAKSAVSCDTLTVPGRYFCTGCTLALHYPVATDTIVEVDAGYKSSTSKYIIVQHAHTSDNYQNFRRFSTDSGATWTSWLAEDYNGQNAVNIYVASDGDDSNNGRDASYPVKTVAMAMRIAKGLKVANQIVLRFGPGLWGNVTIYGTALQCNSIKITNYGNSGSTTKSAFDALTGTNVPPQFGTLTLNGGWFDIGNIDAASVSLHHANLGSTQYFKFANIVAQHAKATIGAACTVKYVSGNTSSVARLEFGSVLNWGNVTTTFESGCTQGTFIQVDNGADIWVHGSASFSGTFAGKKYAFNGLANCRGKAPTAWPGSTAGTGEYVWNSVPTLADKAAKDASGQAIASTYIKNIASAPNSNTTVTVTRGDGTTFTFATRDTNTTYKTFTKATATAAGAEGLVPAPAKGAQAKYLRADATWAIPENTTYSDMVGATSSSVGVHGLVPAPAAGAATRFLRCDGQWQAPIGTTYADMGGAGASAAGTHGLVPAPSAGDQAKCLYGNGTWGVVNDPNAVKVTGTQSVSGNKTFTNTIYYRESLKQQKVSYAWGQSYGTNQFWGTSFTDTGNVALYDILGYLNTPANGGDSCIEFRVFGNPNYSTSDKPTATLGVHCTASGDRYASTHTPSSTADSSTKIATTKWVRDATGNTALNAASATKLATARTINGVAFNGTANITIADSTKVAKAGDTMTGNLTLEKSTPQVRCRDTRAVKGTAPGSTIWNQSFFVQDANGVPYGGVEHGYKDSGENRINLIVYPGNNNQTSQNAQIAVGYDADGNWFTYAPSPATGDSSNKIATTNWVQGNGMAPVSNPQGRDRYTTYTAATNGYVVVGSDGGYVYAYDVTINGYTYTMKHTAYGSWNPGERNFTVFPCKKGWTYRLDCDNGRAWLTWQPCA